MAANLQQSKFEDLIDLLAVYLSRLEECNGDKEQVMREAYTILLKKYDVEELRQKISKMTFDFVGGKNATD